MLLKFNNIRKGKADEKESNYTNYASTSTCQFGAYSDYDDSHNA